MATDNTDLGKLREDLDAVRADIARLAESLKTATGDTARAGVGAARLGAERARVQADEWASELGRRIEERPYGSVLVAFGVGLLLGKLFDRH